jgi:hypothetical protein
MGNDYKYRPRCWSQSRATTWARCQRRFELQYIIGPSAFRAGATPIARESHRLSKLQTLSMALGTSLHKRAAEYARACRDGISPPALHDVRAAVSRDLNFIYTSSRKHRSDNRIDPRAWPRFYETEYGNGPSDDEIVKLKNRAAVCTANLHDLGLWKELRLAGPEGILAIDEPVHFDLGGISIFAAPDLAYVPAEGGPFTIVDFKSSMSARALDMSAIRQQVMVYALYLVVERGFDLVADTCEAKIVCLGDGSVHSMTLTDADLAQMVTVISRSADTIEEGGGYSLGGTDRKPCLPLAENRDECRRCPFLALCASELGIPVIPAKPATATSLTVAVAQPSSAA